MTPEASPPSSYDLLLRDGFVVDPIHGIAERADVAFADGRIADVGKGLPANGARVMDMAGRIVTPGLIDLHAHLYDRVSALGINADAVCLSTGVTSAVDAGTAGSITYPGFRDYCIKPARTRILAFVNVASIGLLLDDEHELGGGRYLDYDELERTLLENGDTAVGIKVRVSVKVLGELGIEPLLRAIEIADKTGTRVMVHITRAKPPIADVFDALRPGDIVTHVLHGHRHSIVEDGRVNRAVFRGQERGVRTDVGHGGGSFSVATARAALADGFRPDTISTDLHAYCINGPCYDLPTTMSKFLSLGLDLPEVVAATTVNAARSIGKDKEIGSLSPGMLGDAAVFDLVDGAFDFSDCMGVTWTGERRLVPYLTVIAGETVWSAQDGDDPH